jgi:hypothetical protein
VERVESGPEGSFKPITQPHDRAGYRKTNSQRRIVNQADASPQNFAFALLIRQKFEYIGGRVSTPNKIKIEFTNLQ